MSALTIAVTPALGLRLGDRRRHRQQECGAPALAVAAHANLAAVQLDDVLDDGQAQTKPHVTARRTAVLLPEAIEDVRKNIWIDALARVGNLQLHGRRDVAQRDGDSATSGSELDGIREQVPHDL